MPLVPGVSLLTAFSCSPSVAYITPSLNRIFEVSAMPSKALIASSKSLLSYAASAATQVSISCREEARSAHGNFQEPGAYELTCLRDMAGG